MAVLAFPRPLSPLAVQAARLAQRERQVELAREVLALALERVETERQRLALLEKNSPRPEPRANETPGSPTAT